MTGRKLLALRPALLLPASAMAQDRAALNATMFHFAATQPVPVMEFKGIWLGGQDFQWRFTRPRTAAAPPDVYVHRWSSQKVLNGQPCRAPKSTG